MLLRTLAAELGDIIFTRPWDNTASSGDLTIEMMDRTDKNLLILYNDKSIVEGKTLKKLTGINEVIRFQSFNDRMLNSNEFRQISLV